METVPSTKVSTNALQNHHQQNVSAKERGPGKTLLPSGQQAAAGEGALSQPRGVKAGAARGEATNGSLRCPNTRHGFFFCTKDKMASCCMGLTSSFIHSNQSFSSDSAYVCSVMYHIKTATLHTDQEGLFHLLHTLQFVIWSIMFPVLLVIYVLIPSSQGPSLREML